MDSLSNFPPALWATLIIGAFFIVLFIVSQWKLFEKAGRPGWAAIVPIYQTIVYIQIAGRPWWWLFLMFIPLVGLFISVMVTVDFAKSFGKSNWFAVGLILFPFIFFPILAFSDSSYQNLEEVPAT